MSISFLELNLTVWTGLWSNRHKCFVKYCDLNNPTDLLYLGSGCGDHSGNLTN